MGWGRPKPDTDRLLSGTHTAPEVSRGPPVLLRMGIPGPHQEEVRLRCSATGFGAHGIPEGHPGPGRGDDGPGGNDYTVSTRRPGAEWGRAPGLPRHGISPRECVPPR